MGYMRLQRIIETFFYIERCHILFLGLFCIKIKVEIFDQNDGLTPLEKCQFCRFLKPMFFAVQKGLSAI